MHDAVTVAYDLNFIRSVQQNSESIEVKRWTGDKFCVGAHNKHRECGCYGNYDFTRQ